VAGGGNSGGLYAYIQTSDTREEDCVTTAGFSRVDSFAVSLGRLKKTKTHERHHVDEARTCGATECGGPCRGRTYGPLIKSLAEDSPQRTLQEESSAKIEE
jgi:hypothetical protein